MVKKSLLEKYSTNIDHKSIFKGLEGFPWKPNRKMQRLRLFQVPFLEQCKIVILIGYNKNNPGTSKANRPGGPLDKNIKSFYEAITSTFSAISADTAQKRLRNMLRILGHEARQQSFGLQQLREIYLSDVRRLRMLSKRKTTTLYHSIEGFLKQLDFLFNKAGMLVRDLPEPQKRSFQVYEELLSRWGDIYHLETQYRNLELNVVHHMDAGGGALYVYGDKHLLEQVLFNLAGNAIKYCYNGTKVRIEYNRLCLPTGNRSVLTVTNFGRRIDCDKPFELGRRGENTAGVEGTGIGLFHSERIAKAHEGSIKPYCEDISQFNIPLIEEYLKRDFDGKNNSVQQRLKKELVGLKTKGILQDAIAYYGRRKRKYKPTDDELVDLINEPTFKIEFKVEIPEYERFDK